MPVPRPAPPPGVLERLTYVKAAPRIVWATLHDPAAQDALFTELRLGPPVPSWPAAGATRSARLRLGLLAANVRLESLEARPATRFQMIVVGDGIRLVRGWYLDDVAGGTRVAATAELSVNGRWTNRLISLGRGSAANVIETNLRILKELAEGGRPAADAPRPAAGRP
ncbi:MAG: hypothetical protein ACRDGQ_05395 [Candidatus Limnocylindrales bacterium]